MCFPIQKFYDVANVSRKTTPSSIGQEPVNKATASYIYLKTSCRARATCLLLCFLIASYGAQTSAAGTTDRIQVIPHALIYEDPSGSLNLPDIEALPEESFYTSQSARLNLGLTSSHLWLRFEPAALIGNFARVILVVPNPIIDNITVHLRTDLGRQTLHGGDRSEFSDRPAIRRLYTFPLSADDLSSMSEVYMRVSGDTPLRLSAYLTDATLFEQAEARELLVRGLFYGVMFALFFYNFFLSLSVRDHSQLYYLSYLLNAIAITAIVDGLPGYFGSWHWWSTWSNEIAVFIVHALLFSGTLFVKTYMRGYDHGESRKDYLHFLAIALVVSAFVALSVHGRIAQTLLLAAVGITLIVLGSTIGYFALSGLRQAKILCVTFFGLALPTAMWFARSSGLLEFDAFSGTVLHLGFGIEAILLSFALADRINHFQRLQQAAEEALAANKQAFTNALLEAQESERRQVSRDLHDSIGQTILALKTRLDRWAKDATGDVAQQFTAASGISESIAGTARQLAHRLHPSILDRLGLALALKELLTPLAESGIETQTELSDEFNQLSDEAALMVYRIMQEGVANITRHSGATRCSLHGLLQNGGLTLNLEDNGHGDAELISASGGFGVNSMRERAKIVRSKIEWRDVIGGGIRVSLVIPYATTKDTDAIESLDR